MKYSEITAELGEFVAESREVYGSYAHASGVFQSMLASVLADLPVANQQRILQSIKLIALH